MISTFLSMIKNCLVCNEEFKPQTSNVKRGLGKYCSRKCYFKNNRGSNNPTWKGKDANYISVHMWVYNQWGKAYFCENDKTHITKRYEWANLSGKYKRECSDWKMLCTMCHSKLDDKSGKMKLIRKKQEEEKYLLKVKLGKSTRIPYSTQKYHRYLARKAVQNA